MRSTRPRRAALAAFLILALVALVAAVDADTGLPLPRFVSLRADEVNMRTGPGTRYPVEWVYRRQGLPMEIIAEYDTWRRVRDWQGIDGWVHSSMLSGERSVVITGGVRVLRGKGDPESPPVARAEAGVIGRLLECPEETDWCRVEIDGVRGWLRRDAFWGVYDGEVLE
jgi:SH3-like domain-containing protein